jgi:DNA polymerase-3 subunit gamma/tau
VIGLINALITHDAATGLTLIHQVVGDGVDPRQFAREMVTYLRWIMLVKFGRDSVTLNLPDDLLEKVQEHAGVVDPALILYATRRFNEAQVDIKSGLLAIPQLPLELAFVDSLEYVPVSPVVRHSGIVPARPVGPPAAPSTPIPARPEPSSPAAATTREATVPEQVEGAPELVPPAEQGASPLTREMVMAVFERALDDLESGRTKDGRRGTMIAKALRYNTHLAEVTGNKLLFATSDLMKGKFEKAQPLANIEDVFSRLLGQPVKVSFMVDQDRKAGGSSDVAEPPGIDSQTDDLLRTAESLGGEINQGSR